VFTLEQRREIKPNIAQKVSWPGNELDEPGGLPTRHRPAKL